MFELALPWVLLLVLVPPFVWYVWPQAALKLPAALKIPFYQPLQQAVTQHKQAFAGTKHMGVLFLVWSLLVLALSGPRWVGEPIALNREGRNIMMVLDLSGSMELGDMVMNGRLVSRLTVVKQAAEQFVKARQGDRIGLILFGSQAYLQTPLTYDLRNVLQRIEDASVGLAGKTTSIGDALGLAVKRLQDVAPDSRVVILLTDGANNSGVLAPQKAAELAKGDGIKVYTIGLGAELDPRVNNSAFFNVNAGADLDEKTLKEIAAMTDGRYFRATDADSLQAIYAMINQLEKSSQEQETLRPQHEYYSWPLALALLLFAWFLAAQSSLGSRIPALLRRKEQWQ